MTPFRRTWVIALGATLALLSFLLAIAAMTPMFAKTIGAHNGRGLGVTYTFEKYNCLGTATQFRSCRWLGTITAEPDSADGPSGQDLLASNVVFRDIPPDEVQPGDTIDALWTETDPTNAYDFYSSSAWLTTLASGLVACAGAVLFFVVAVIWWRRLFSFNRGKTSKKQCPASKPLDHQAG